MAPSGPVHWPAVIALLVACPAACVHAATIDVPPYAAVDAPDGWVRSDPANAVTPLDTRGNVNGTVLGILHPADRKPGELPYALVSEKAASFRFTPAEFDLAAQVAHGLYGGGEVLAPGGNSSKLAEASTRSPLRLDAAAGEFAFEATYDAGKPTERQVAVASRFVPLHQLSIAVWSDAAYARAHAAELSRLRDGLRERQSPQPKPPGTLNQMSNVSRIVVLGGVALVALLAALSRRSGSGDETRDAMP